MSETQTDEAKQQTAYETPQRIEGEQGLYWRGGMIYARVRVHGKQTFRCTGTDKLATARKIQAKWREDAVLRQHGIEPKQAALERNRLTVAAVLKEYVEFGFPDRKSRIKKTAATRETEGKSIQRLEAFFGPLAAVSLTLKDCDAYRKWRANGGYTWQRGEKLRRSRAGDRCVDIELQTLGNALALAVRQEKLKVNPLTGRGRYHSEEDTRHCRETAPTPQQLQIIAQTFRERGEDVIADCLLFLGFSGLRVREGLRLDWEAVDWAAGVIHVKREKRGINPFVPILPEMETLLREMQTRARSHLLFPSDVDANRPLPYPILAMRLSRLCRSTGMRYVTLHGLRSFFVTQCRESGLPDTEIAALIGDKSGPAIIARTYGDVRPEHLLKQAQRVRFLAGVKPDAEAPKFVVPQRPQSIRP
jgi:integrase